MAEQKNHNDGRSHEIDFSDPHVTNAWLAEVDSDLDESDRQALAEEIVTNFGVTRGIAHLWTRE